MKNSKKTKYFRSLITGDVFRRSDFKKKWRLGGICFSHHKKQNIKPIDKKFNDIFDGNLAKRKLLGCVFKNGSPIKYLFR
jgi:hypothetical protein